VRRLALLSCLAAAGCATSVKDWSAEQPLEPGYALLAGRLQHDRLLVEGPAGQEFDIRPAAETFLVALPVGTYVVRGFSELESVDDSVSFEAVAGRALYIGDFGPVANREGLLVVPVYDERGATVEELRDRYGARLPDVDPGLVRSAVDIIGDHFLIRVARPEPSRVTYSIGFGFGSYGRGSSVSVGTRGHR
jgi:hypothetical protein